MMTMADVRSLLTASENNKQQIEEDIRELAARSQQIEKEMQTAAEARNLDQYSRLKDEREMISDAIRAKRERLMSAGKDFSKRSEILSAWTSYCSRHNAAFAVKMRRYELARAALCKQFIELAEMQREALINQHLINCAVNADRQAAAIGSMDSDMTKLELMDSKRPLGKGIEQSYPDAACFAASGLLSREALQTAYTVCVAQAPCDTPIK